MKVFYTVLKVLAALAVVAGIIYVIATYGDKIVSWAKGMSRWFKRNCYDDECFDEFDDDSFEMEDAAFEG